MGKNNKKNKNSNLNKLDNNLDNKLTVSIITISQSSRFEFLKILFDLIKNQTYTNIIEWVIVEGSKNLNDANTNKEQIYSMIKEKKTQVNFQINYINNNQNNLNLKLGELRNIGNKQCIGDITVCMDDDDYYPPTRVEHVLKKLSESNFKIAGCSNHYMYDYNLNMLVQLKVFGKYHSPNSCMAWKKEYLLNNSHDPSKDFGEESSFTKNFTEPMVQLDPEYTVITSSHNSNTFSKKKFFISVANNIDSSVDKIIKIPITNFIPEDYFNRYNKIFNPNVNSTPDNEYFNYDIVYMCGTFSINWNPCEKNLGGSEQAVINLSENWVKSGKKVIVYGEVPDIILNGVQYKPWYNFNYNIKYKNLILWRIYGLLTVIPFNVKADFIIYDIHDNLVSQPQEFYIKYKHFANKIFLKSNYHKECFLQQIDPNFDKNKLIIIPNGVRINLFSNIISNVILNPKDNSESILISNRNTRNPFRFCYCSCYSRGLDVIINKIWSIIYTYEPRAELHVYYGMDSIKNDEYKKYLQILLSYPGVMDHGSQPVEIISREKQLSTFHLYLSNTKAEIDCISIKESIIAGCIPIISNFGVFKERDGIHLDFDDDKKIKLTAVYIIDLLKNPKKVDQYKNQIEKWKTNISSWEQISLEWDKYFL